MSVIEGAAVSYRTRPDVGPDPVTEADAVVELIRRTTALRRRLLVLALGASLLVGWGGVEVFRLSLHETVTTHYRHLANQVLERVLLSGAVVFVVGAIVAFVLLRWIGERVARAREAAWIAELSRRHALRPGALAEVLAMFRG